MAEEYPSLYNIVHHKTMTVADIMTLVPLNTGIRRSLTRKKWDRWLHRY
jgi:hypothetical protein